MLNKYLNAVYIINKTFVVKALHNTTKQHITERHLLNTINHLVSFTNTNVSKCGRKQTATR